MTSRAIYIALSACISIAIAYFGAPLLKESKEAVNGLINVFAILAGVLVAVISIIGDPAMLMPGNWRVGFEHAKDTQKKIARHSLLFAVYIASLTILITAMVLRDANAPSVSESILSYIGVNRQKDCGFIFYIAAFFSSWSILLSLPLPFNLMSIQKERMQHEIESRKTRFSDNRNENRNTHESEN